MHPDFGALIIFLFVGAFSPGPNNLLASYSGFNFGIKRTMPLICGVTFGFPSLLIVVNFSLIFIFENLPILQEILKILGSVFLIFLAYKIAITEQNETKKIENPAKFLNMLIFQFINPKALLVAIIAVSTFIRQESFVRDTILVVMLSVVFAFISIFSWSLLGKFLQRFANNVFFLKIYNYILSFLLIVCVIMFYV